MLSNSKMYNHPVEELAECLVDEENGVFIFYPKGDRRNFIIFNEDGLEPRPEGDRGRSTANQSRSVQVKNVETQTTDTSVAPHGKKPSFSRLSGSKRSSGCSRTGKKNSVTFSQDVNRKEGQHVKRAKTKHFPEGFHESLYQKSSSPCAIDPAGNSKDELNLEMSTTKDIPKADSKDEFSQRSTSPYRYELANCLEDSEETRNDQNEQMPEIPPKRHDKPYETVSRNKGISEDYTNSLNDKSPQNRKDDAENTSKTKDTEALSADEFYGVNSTNKYREKNSLSLPNQQLAECLMDELYGVFLVYPNKQRTLPGGSEEKGARERDKPERKDGSPKAENELVIGQGGRSFCLVLAESDGRPRTVETQTAAANELDKQGDFSSQHEICSEGFSRGSLPPTKSPPTTSDSRQNVLEKTSPVAEGKTGADAWNSGMAKMSEEDYGNLVEGQTQDYDVLVYVSSDIFNAHREELSANSKTLADLLRSKFPAKAHLRCEIHLKEVTPEAFRVFHRFVYTGGLELTPVNVIEVLLAAEFLKSAGFLDQVCEVAEGHLAAVNIDSVIKTLNSSALPYTCEVRDFIARFVLSRFPQVHFRQSFLNLNQRAVTNLLTQNVCDIPEFQLFQAAFKWINFQPERKKQTRAVFGCIRFGRMSPKQVIETAEMLKTVRSSYDFRAHFLEACWMATILKENCSDPFNIKIPEKRKNLSQAPSSGLAKAGTQGIADSNLKAYKASKIPFIPEAIDNDISSSPYRRGREIQGDIICVLGYQSSNMKLRYGIREFCVEKNKWLPPVDLPKQMQRFALVRVDDRLYIIGGGEHKSKITKLQATNTVLCYNLSTEKWEEMPPMHEKRINHCACVLLETIYVIGGRDEKERVLDTVECYISEWKKWVFIESLQVGRFGAAAESYNSNVYVAGGLSANSLTSAALLKSVECYSPAEERWTSCSGLTFPRCFSCMHTVGGRLFICGGTKLSHNKRLESINTVEEYREDVGWRETTPIPTARYDYGIAAMGDCLYVLGGKTGPEDMLIQTVDCFNINTEKWDIFSTINLPYNFITSVSNSEFFKNVE